MPAEDRNVERRILLLLFLLNIVTGLNFAQNTPREFRAEDFAGPDTGARIRAADAACAATAQACNITVNRPGPITSAVTLAARHSLLFRADVEVQAKISPAGSQAISCDGGVTLTFSRTAGTIEPLPGATDIRINGCKAKGVGQNFVQLPGRNARITVSGNTSTGFKDTLLACASAPRPGGGGWDLGLLCHDIDFVDNTVLSATGAGTQYAGVAGGHISGNTIGHAAEGIYLNGGEADPTHALFAFHSNGLSGIQVTGNRVDDINNGCIWASVSTGHIFRGNHLSHCGDVGLDFEGVANSRTQNNTIVDAGRRGGALATFFGSSNIEFAGDAISITQTAGSNAGAAIWVHNSTNDPAFTGPISFSGVTVQSALPGAPTPAIFESQHGLQITNSHFVNVQLQMPFRFQNILVKGNEFRYSVPVSGAAVAIGVSLYGGADTVTGNRFVSSVPQPSGSAALSMAYGDFNATEQFNVEGNDFTQASAFPADVVISHQGQNPGVGSRWILRGNRMNRATVTRSNGVGSFSVDSDGPTDRR